MGLCDAYNRVGVVVPGMGDTSIRVSEELADELYSRKGRSTSYEEFIWQLLNGEGAADDGGESNDSSERVAEIVADARADWADEPDARRQARVDSLRAALEAVREEPLTKSELQEVAYPDGNDLGQNERTWFRKTVKPWLSKVADYSNSDQKWHYTGEVDR